jgi:hypothetical protein
MRPSAPTTNVERTTPQYFTPNSDLRCQTPYASATAWSVSARRVYGSAYFSRNFRCDRTSSGLIPRIAAPIPSNRGKALLKSSASLVQPGVSSFG